MVTDRPPRRKELRAQFEDSERRATLPLPPAADLQQAARALDDALKAATQAAVLRAGKDTLEVLAGHYAVPRPNLVVLGVRPHRVHDGSLSYELFGDYALQTQRIRVWMKTAIRGKVTSYRGLLNTLLHEFCHHLDVRQLGFEDTPHTRGFYARIDQLYHLALATPPQSRKPLVWRKRGQIYVIDWARMRATGTNRVSTSSR